MSKEDADQTEYCSHSGPAQAWEEMGLLSMLGDKGIIFSLNVLFSLHTCISFLKDRNNESH